VRDWAKVPAWLTHALVTPSMRSVYIAIALHADRDGSCWPSHATLAQFSGLSVRSVGVALNGLRALGVVAWEKRHDSRGQTSNRFTICMSTEPHALMGDGRICGHLGAESAVTPAQNLRTNEIHRNTTQRNESTARRASAPQREWLCDLHVLGGGTSPLELPDDLSVEDADEMIQEAMSVLGYGAEYRGPCKRGDPGWDLLTAKGRETARRRLRPPRRTA
jgi:hypothetical protein